MISLKDVSVNKSTVSVSWNNSYDSISLLSIVFDDDGSCTNVGLEPTSLSFSTKNLSQYRDYVVYLKALTEDGWVTSDKKEFRLA